MDRVRPLGSCDPIELTDVQAGWVETVMRNVVFGPSADTISLIYGQCQISTGLPNEAFAVAVGDAVRWLVSRAVQLASHGAATCTDLRGREVRLLREPEPHQLRMVFLVPDDGSQTQAQAGRLYPRPRRPRDRVEFVIEDTQIQQLLAALARKEDSNAVGT